MDRRVWQIVATISAKWVKYELLISGTELMVLDVHISGNGLEEF